VRLDPRIQRPAESVEGRRAWAGVGCKLELEGTYLVADADRSRRMEGELAHNRVGTVEGCRHAANIESPKSRAGRRTFVLPDTLIEELNEHLARFTEPIPTARVFTGEKGGPLRRHVFYKHWRHASQQVDLPNGFVFHDLRHTAQTLGGLAGATQADLKHRGGHTSDQAVMRYQHATPENDRRVAEEMNRRLVEAKTNRAINAPSLGAVDSEARSDADEVASECGRSDESGRRESNPRSQLGKLMFCR
jgi:Phage integrase family